MPKFLKFSVLLISTLLAVSCGGNSSGGGTPSPQPGPEPGPEPEPVEPVEVERVYVSYDTGSMICGNNRTVNANYFPYNATPKLKYISSDDTIIEPTESGIIYGVGIGTATVTCYNDTNENDIFDEGEPAGYVVYTITAPESGKSVSLSDKTLTLEVDEEHQSSVTKTGISSSYLSYYVRDPEIASIVPDGYNKVKIKGLRAGKTTVSVTSDGYDGKCEVTVVDHVDEKGLRAEAIEFEKTVYTIKLGETLTPKYSIYPKNAVDKASKIISNNNVLSYHDLSVTATEVGTSIITISTENGKTAQARVVVSDDSIDEKVYYDNYYGDLTWENGEDLKQKLHDIISQNKKALAYDGNWESNMDMDHDKYDLGYVNAVYTDDPILKSATQQGWQKEHVFPASLMTGLDTGVAVKATASNPGIERARDLHNLFAGESSANGSRGNKNYGYADINSDSYKDLDSYSYDKYNFESNDIDKGRLARATFYMGVMYMDEDQISITESGENIDITLKGLQIVEENVGFSNKKLTAFTSPKDVAETTFANIYKDIARKNNPEASEEDLPVLAYEEYRNESSPYATGNLSTLLKWNSFPVDYEEMQHNESVYSYNSVAGGGTQGNRNPFVDYPELVEYVYGGLQNTPGSLKELQSSAKYLSLDDGEVIRHYTYDSSKFITFNSGETFDITKCGIKGVRNDFTSVEPDYSKFTYPAITFTEEDCDTGKDVTISTDRNTFDLHINVISSGLIGHGGNYLEDCNYWYRAVANKGTTDFGGTNGSEFNATFGSQKFTITLKNSCKIQNINQDPCGVTIGTGSAPCGTFTMVSETLFEDVHAIYFDASGAKDSHYSYSIKVGDDEVLSGTIDGNIINNCGGKLASKKTGIITISITGVNAALKLNGFGINTYDK